MPGQSVARKIDMQPVQGVPGGLRVGPVIEQTPIAARQGPTAGANPFAPQDDVGVQAQAGDEGAFLVHESDTAGSGMTRGLWPEGLAFQNDLAGKPAGFPSRWMSGQNAQERGLP